MKKNKNVSRIAILAFAVLAACTPGPKPIIPQEAINSPPAYNYPINNPYAATIIGLPPEMKVDYSSVPKPEEKTLTLFKRRPVPEGFWYQDGFQYSQLIQPNPAPVVYVIAGTGADSKGETIHTISDILYSGGFSVVLLPSPTHPNFIINASQNFIVGRPSQDAEDLYRVIKTINNKLSQTQKITGNMLIGYSLGALDAVYTEKVDDREKALNFGKVLLINPPLSLYSSMKVIDDLLYRALPNGINDADHFVKTAVSRLSRVNQTGEALNFQNERLLLDAYNQYKPNDNRLASIIGLSFRISAADMIFTADVMCHCNYIFPGNLEFKTSTRLNNYLGVALRTSYQNYFDDIYTEKFQSEDTRLTKQALVDESNLESLSGYIKGNPKLGLITNQDDIILAPGEVQKLVSIFGQNSVVFPNGGHLGNLATPAVAYHIIQFMKQ